MDEQEEKLYFALRERDQWMQQCLEAETQRDRYNQELLKVDSVLFDWLKYGPNEGTRAEIMADLADAVEANAKLIAELEARLQGYQGHPSLRETDAICDRYREVIQSFLSTVLTVKRENQPEWMEYLAERINEVCEVIGEEDRVSYNSRQEAILPLK